jgi:putative hemolysin
VEELMRLIKEEEYSRIPVYRETIDDVVGVCYAKDILSLMSKRKCENVIKMKVKDIMREPFFVPETMKISDLLKELRDKKIHIAIVVDEFGGTAGIVTFEDIIEELIGEVYDEYDQGETVGIKKLEGNAYLIDAMTPLNDIERELGVKFPDTEYETLAGYLLEVFQRIPSTGEEIRVGNFYFKIVASGRNRIEKVLMKVIDDGRETGGDSKESA